MNPFKQLAGQTAIYGLGTILPRMLNYLLVPLYTRVFVPEIYGQFTELYAYIALLLALLTYGMETTFFRHGKGNDFKKVYGNIMTGILSTTSAFLLGLVLLYPALSQAIGYGTKSVYVLFTGLVVAADAVSAVPFCVLRQQNKAKRFSFIKMANVCTNIALNLFFLVLVPERSALWADSLFGTEAGMLTWVFVSNLVASLLNIVLLWPQVRQIRLQFDWSLMRQLLKYSIPIMLISLIGMVNEVADKIAVKYLTPAGEADAQLGIYGACYKLAVLMTIFVQMFRYASEPFFFSRAEDRNSPSLFADVMKYFVIFCLVIFLMITLYLDVFGLFIGTEFREGLGIVPIVLLANLFMGVVFNLSIWYKLSDNTSSGTVITAVGAVVTLVCLFLLIPVIGYWGAAIAHLACYSIMMVISFLWGQKVYPIPYQVGRILSYVIFALALFALSRIFVPENKVLMYVVNTAYLLLFCGVAFRLDLKNALRN